MNKIGLSGLYAYVYFSFYSKLQRMKRSGAGFSSAMFLLLCHMGQIFLLVVIYMRWRGIHHFKKIEAIKGYEFLVAIALMAILGGIYSWYYQKKILRKGETAIVSEYRDGDFALSVAIILIPFVIAISMVP